MPDKKEALLPNEPLPLLAGNRDLATTTPRQLYAGSSDIVHQSGVAAAAIKQFEVIARDATGKLIPFTGKAAAEGEEVAAAIGIALIGVAKDSSVQFAVGGTFNHEALLWPADITTLVARQAVFDRTNIIIDELF